MTILNTWVSTLNDWVIICLVNDFLWIVFMKKSSKVYLFRKFCWPSLLLVFYSRGNQNQIDGSTES